MSSVKWYRRLNLTPAPNEGSPALPYFTPKKRVNLAKSQEKFLKTPNPNIFCESLSAEHFRKREVIRKRYRFYNRSPSTPLYERCQCVKKMLVFSDDDADDDTEASTGKMEDNLQNMDSIPTFVLTSPSTNNVYSPHKTNVLTKTPCLNQPKTSKQILQTGDEYSSSSCKMATPNTMFILKNLSPLGNHKLLGKGRFGCVIESCYKNVKVAIKVIDMSKRKLKSSILGEQNAIGLRHPNIVQINSITWPKDRINGRYCIIMMEWCSMANNLEKVLSNDNGMFITPERIVRYSLDICRALHFLHSKDILHLDVKPKNILLMCPNDYCKLCDFGSSLKYSCSIKEDNFSLFRGTAQYCCPEILRGLVPTPASDVYSLGITMWQFLHCTIPYGKEIQEESLIYRVVKDGLRPHTNLNVSNNFVCFYHKIYSACWLENPRERLTPDRVLKHLNDLKLLLSNFCNQPYHK